MHSMTEIKGFRGDYGYLSNFYPCQISYEGVLFPSVETAFQAAKCMNPVERIQFQRYSASEAKRMGKRIKLRPDWEQVKFSIMFELVRQKFMDNPNLKAALKATGDALLVEENTWHDNVYGNCICSRCKKMHGENKLGRILMEIRKQL